jgi:hypothetical protein
LIEADEQGGHYCGGNKTPQYPLYNGFSFLLLLRSTAGTVYSASLTHSFLLF